jgi:putative DNA methylase
MTAAVAAKQQTKPGLAPFSLKDAPSFIEAQFPVGRLSGEAYKERKAGAGQTLTALGSYWKGRKPLILVRAVVLGALLPTTDEPAKDLEIFLKLMAMDDEGIGRRIKALKASDIDPSWQDVGQYVSYESGKPKWLAKLDEELLARLVKEWFPTLPYERRLKFCSRLEECDEGDLLADIWPEVNRHLGTDANSIPELIEQLGIARFGHRPRLADTFCGGGSIPFEAARMGCDIYASDLNPIACMLTWGAFNIIGAPPARRAEIEQAQEEVEAAVDADITRLGIEHDKYGNRAKAYLYCLETRCPKTDWMVPMAPSWVISKTRNVVAKLIPDQAAKRYRIEVHSGVSRQEMAEAEEGTVRNGRLVHPMNPERSGVEIKTIRGDYRDASGVNQNRLRLWEKSDFVPRPEDVWQERLYAIQWVAAANLFKRRSETYFATVNDDDLLRERKVESTVRENLARWQEQGFAPEMAIEPGDETTRLFRERGWTHWHHLFSARQLLTIATYSSRALRIPECAINIAELANFYSRLCSVKAGGAGPRPEEIWIGGVFSNQALNTLFNFGCRSFWAFPEKKRRYSELATIKREIETSSATEITVGSDLFVTDPPYADAINYHEITEFFIAWLRKNPPPPFDQWTWDSRRSLAIKGKDDTFRRDMVAAYAAMTRHMPENGIQVVMFTHQDAGVWADLGAILWAAGLRVTAAWNIVTETESALKAGNYVQGTVCLVLRKRLSEANARRMEIEAEIEQAVAQQLDRLTALDETWTAETLYTDGDLTLAAYAAALQVVTSYSTIDRQPLDRDLYRNLDKGERTMIRGLVDYAAQVANGLLVPTGFLRDAWRDLGPSERFYVRMLDMESKGVTKVADFQNFAKSFAYGDYTSLMASTAANAARLAGAAELKGRMLDGDGFAKTQLRQVLFGIWKTLDGQERDPKRGVTILKTEYAADYWQRRQKLIELAEYIAAKTKGTRPHESAAAHELAEALKVDRV